VDELIKKATLALLEGDREEVLRLLSYRQPSTQVMWLRAHAVKEDDQRIALLRQIATSGHPVYAPLARNILDRENQFEIDLAKPAEYKFWTRQPWSGRVKFLKKNKFWLIGGLVLLVVIIIVISIVLSQNAQIQNTIISVSLTETASAQLTGQTTSLPTPSDTPSPTSSQGFVNDSHGKLSMSPGEFSTTRPFAPGNLGQDDAVSTPAIGLQFAALQVITGDNSPFLEINMPK